MNFLTGSLSHENVGGKSDSNSDNNIRERLTDHVLIMKIFLAFYICWKLDLGILKFIRFNSGSYKKNSNKTFVTSNTAFIWSYDLTHLG